MCKIFLRLKNEPFNPTKLTRELKNIVIILPANIFYKTETLSKTEFSEIISEINDFIRKFGDKVVILKPEGEEYLLPGARVVNYSPPVRILSRQFFRLKKVLRSLNPDVSIDLNKKDDILSYLVGAKMRLGTQRSRFINCRLLIDTKNIDYSEMCEKLIDLFYKFAWKE